MIAASTARACVRACSHMHAGAWVHALGRQGQAALSRLSDAHAVTVCVRPFARRRRQGSAWTLDALQLCQELRTHCKDAVGHGLQHRMRR